MKKRKLFKKLLALIYWTIAFGASGMFLASGSFRISFLIPFLAVMLLILFLIKKKRPSILIEQIYWTLAIKALILFISKTELVYGLLGFLCIISLRIFWAAFRSPITRRIGFRNVRRRLGNTILVIIGSMVGAALISGSLVMSDSLDKTFINLVEEQLGEIDLSIDAYPKADDGSSFATFSSEELNQIKTSLNKSEVDGVMPSLQFIISPRKIDSEGNTIINAYQVNIHATNFDTVSEFGESPQVFDSPKEKNGAMISETMADSLDLSEGDLIRTDIAGTEVTMVVDKIYTDKGILGGKRIVVSNEFLTSELGLPNETYNAIYVSAKGGVRPNSYNGSEFEDFVKEQLKDFSSVNTGLSISEIKQQALDGYGMKSFSIAFLALSMFGIFAGVLLIVNLYMMLASERKTEMGILRAIALKRGELAKTFIYEGYVYSIISAFLGALLGLLVGFVLIFVLRGIFERMFELAGGGGFSILFGFKLKSLITAFSIGALITILTSAFASYKISKLNIVSAIRNTDEDKYQRLTKTWIFRTLLLTVGLIMSSVTFALSFAIKKIFENMRDTGGEDNYFAKLSQDKFNELTDLLRAYFLYFGLVFMLLTAAALLCRLVKFLANKDISKYAYSLISIVLIIFTALMGKWDVMANVAESDYSAILIFISGVVLVFASVLIVTFNLALIVNLANKLKFPIKSFKTTLLIGLRYPAEYRSRTGLTLVMFSLIIFLIAFVSIEKAVVNNQMDTGLNEAIGGYDLIVYPNSIGGNPDVDKIVETMDNIDGLKKVDEIFSVNVILPAYRYKDLAEVASTEGGPEMIAYYEEEDYFHTSIDALPKDFILNQNMELSEYSSEYKSSADVWNAIANDNSKIVLGSNFDANSYIRRPDLKVGDKIKVADIYNNMTTEKEVIGLVKTDMTGGGFGMYQNIVTTDEQAKKEWTPEYVYKNSSVTILAKIKEGEKASEVLKTVKMSLAKYNIFFVMDVSDLIGEIQTFMNSFMGMFQGFLAFSLIVGTSGLAIILVRSVNERRQQIGMLRSLGFQRRMILSSFFIEATFITFMGIIIGIFSGIIGTNTVFQMVSSTDPGMKIIIPWGEIIIICILVYIASIIFSLAPSIKASRLSPVEATNYPE